MSIRHIEAVFKNAELKSTSKLVALALADHADSETGACFPSIALLAKKTSLSKPAVITAVKNLENLGYLKVKRDPVPCKKNRYWLSASALLSKIWAKDDAESPGSLVKEIDQPNSCVVKEVDQGSQGARPSDTASGQGGLPARSRRFTRLVKEVYLLGQGGLPSLVKEVYPNRHNRHINRQINRHINQRDQNNFYDGNDYTDDLIPDDDTSEDLSAMDPKASEAYTWGSVGEEGEDNLNYDFEHDIKPEEVKKTSEPKPIDLSAIGKAIIKDAPKIELTETEWEESRLRVRRSLDALTRQVSKETEEGVEW